MNKVGKPTLRAAAIPQSGKISLLRRAHPARRAFCIIGNLSKFPIIQKRSLFFPEHMPLQSFKQPLSKRHLKVTRNLLICQQKNSVLFKNRTQSVFARICLYSKSSFRYFYLFCRFFISKNTLFYFSIAQHTIFYFFRPIFL